MRKILIFFCFGIYFCLKHPGGGELITDVAGRDCSKEFDDFGHSSDAKNMLKNFKIGELVEVIKKKKTTYRMENKNFMILCCCYCLNRRTKKSIERRKPPNKPKKLKIMNLK